MNFFELFHVMLSKSAVATKLIIKARGYVAYVFYFLKDTHVR